MNGSSEVWPKLEFIAKLLDRILNGELMRFSASRLLASLTVYDRRLYYPES